MPKRKRSKIPNTPLQGMLQSQIAKSRWTEGLNMAMSIPSPQQQNSSSSNDELRTMSDQMLREMSSWARRMGNLNLFGQVESIFRERTSTTSTTAVRPDTQISYSPTSGQTITFYNEEGVEKLSPKKPTQKVGDWVKLTKNYVFQSKKIKVDKGAVGHVNKVGTRYVYVQFEGLPGNQALQIDSSNLEEAEDPTPKELDLSRVVMPDDHREAIKEAVAQLEHNDKIFQDWGFDDILEKGKAISMLFFGPPGTGKTMCAEIIAKSLGKKLEIIGTGEVQSSEPGQAERNIKAYFEKSDKDTMLLFDECDSLVHSRNNTGSIMAAQINALLTALERYEGIVIFTTNRLGVLDEAFNRRLSLKLHFPMPSKEERLQIWKGTFPEKAPLSKDIKWEKLAALELTGGYIKNIVLRAARSAATQGLDTITYEVLKNAAIHEEMSKREFEEAARHHRRGGVTTIDEAIQDFGQDNRLEIKNAHARTSSRARKDQKK